MKSQNTISLQNRKSKNIKMILFKIKIKASSLLLLKIEKKKQLKAVLHK